MAGRLMRVPRVREVESSFPKGRPNLTQRCKRFATDSTSTHVAVLPWRYDAEMGIANSLHASANYGECNEGFGWFDETRTGVSVSKTSTRLFQNF